MSTVTSGGDRSWIPSLHQINQLPFVSLFNTHIQTILCMGKIYLQILLKTGIFCLCTVTYKDQISKKYKYINKVKCFWGHKVDVLKLESALVLWNLEVVAVCCSLRNHRLIIFMLKDETEDRNKMNQGWFHGYISAYNLWTRWLSGGWEISLGEMYSYEKQMTFILNVLISDSTRKCTHIHKHQSFRYFWINLTFQSQKFYWIIKSALSWDFCIGSLDLSLQ